MAFVVTWEPDYTKNPSKAPGFLKKVPMLDSLDMAVASL